MAGTKKCLMKEVLNLKVCELRILLLQNVRHVVDQMKTKSVLGGDFLPSTEQNFYIWLMKHSRMPYDTGYAHAYVFSREFDAGGVML